MYPQLEMTIATLTESKNLRSALGKLATSEFIRQEFLAEPETLATRLGLAFNERELRCLQGVLRAIEYLPAEEAQDVYRLAIGGDKIIK